MLKFSKSYISALLVGCDGLALRGATSGAIFSEDFSARGATSSGGIQRGTTARLETVEMETVEMETVEMEECIAARLETVEMEECIDKLTDEQRIELLDEVYMCSESLIMNNEEAKESSEVSSGLFPLAKDVSSDEAVISDETCMPDEREDTKDVISDETEDTKVRTDTKVRKENLEAGGDKGAPQNSDEQTLFSPALVQQFLPGYTASNEEDLATKSRRRGKAPSKVPCIHGKKNPSRCVECGGSSICEHKRYRYTCKDCGGAGRCTHGRMRYACKECGGASLCEHGRDRSQCKKCGGGSICEHGRRRTHCRECGGGAFCTHGRWRSHCKECGGGTLCTHGRRRTLCKECGGGGLCEHGKRRSQCKECKANNTKKT